MRDGGACPFCKGTGKNPNSVIPCGVHGATSQDNETSAATGSERNENE
jgi:hypothetical protein